MCGAAQSRVVHNSPEYVVISKPPGVPVAPTVDNILECTLTGAAQVGKLPDVLYFAPSTYGLEHIYVTLTDVHVVFAVCIRGDYAWMPQRAGNDNGCLLCVSTMLSACHQNQLLISAPQTF